MLLFTIFTIFATIESDTLEGVCGRCGLDERRRLQGNHVPVISCPSHDVDIEGCVLLGVDYRCYWKNTSIINIGGDYTRECSNDGDCYNLDNTIYDSDTRAPHCLRCCANNEIGKDLCTQTIITSVDHNSRCGDPDLNLFGTTAPCCADENCLDNKLGICGDIAEECESCMTWTNFEHEPIMKHNCNEGLFCLTDGTDIEFTEGSAIFVELRRRNLLRYNDKVIFGNGICIPQDGISQLKKDCENDNECPSCMRCCLSSDGINKQCIRSSGNNCGFSTRGPCCCPEDICKYNECEIPSASPSKSPTNITPLPSKGPTNITPLPSKGPTNITPLPTKGPTRDNRRLLGFNNVNNNNKK